MSENSSKRVTEDYMLNNMWCGYLPPSYMDCRKALGDNFSFEVFEKVSKESYVKVHKNLKESGGLFGNYELLLETARNLGMELYEAWSVLENDAAKCVQEKWDALFGRKAVCTPLQLAVLGARD